MSDHFQAELRFLGIASSPAFVREPEGNGCAERFVRTLKEQLLWIERFATVEALRLALLAFKDRYNRDWLIERHGHRSPASVRAAFARRHRAALTRRMRSEYHHPVCPRNRERNTRDYARRADRLRERGYSQIRTRPEVPPDRPASKRQLSRLGGEVGGIGEHVWERRWAHYVASLRGGVTIWLRQRAPATGLHRPSAALPTPGTAAAGHWLRPRAVGSGGVS